MKRIGALLILVSITTHAQAWTFRDLWKTPDQQAARLMQDGQFDQAKHLFKNAAWQATAAFRSTDYADASLRFDALQNADGYYNQGNAFARLGQYEQALHAYEQSLSTRPNDPDTLHNQALVKTLIKKNQNPQDKQAQDKQAQDKQAQDKQAQDKQAQDKQAQNKPGKAGRSPEQRANDQWLRMIPDDPGGLLREKFLRDHVRRVRQEAS